MFEDGEKLRIDEEVFEKLEQKDILQTVYTEAVQQILV